MFGKRNFGRLCMSVLSSCTEALFPVQLLSACEFQLCIVYLTIIYFCLESQWSWVFPKENVADVEGRHWGCGCCVIVEKKFKFSASLGILGLISKHKGRQWRMRSDKMYYRIFGTSWMFEKCSNGQTVASERMSSWLHGRVSWSGPFMLGSYPSRLWVGCTWQMHSIQWSQRKQTRGHWRYCILYENWFKGISKITIATQWEHHPRALGFR